jgi:DNA-binding response OmpR family regulator
MATKLVERDGQSVELTGREYGIVAALMRRIGAVVSREELYHSVIDETDDSMSNLLDVHVCNLRKKLGRQFIVTVRGRGYRIDPDKA